MNGPSKVPLLFDVKGFQLWTHAYRTYYGQEDGWMGTFIPFSFSLQMGQGRNAATLMLLNFGVTLSWSARRSAKAVEMPNRGPVIKAMCTCGKEAGTMIPMCEACIAERLIGFKELK